MNKRLLILLIILCVTESYAQTDSLTRKVKYFNTFQSGTLIGCGECNSGKDFTLSFVTMHGVAFKSGFRLAGGIGLDVYDEWRIFPLLVGFTIDKGLKSNAVYFHINTGYSFAHYLDENPYESGDITQKGGFTINPMIGYRIGNEKVRLYVQAGFKFQEASYTKEYNWGYSTSRDYDLNRVVVQMGFGFN